MLLILYRYEIFNPFGVAGMGVSSLPRAATAFRQSCTGLSVFHTSGVKNDKNIRLYFFSLFCTFAPFLKNISNDKQCFSPRIVFRLKAGL